MNGLAPRISLAASFVVLLCVLFSTTLKAQVAPAPQSSSALQLVGTVSLVKGVVTASSTQRDLTTLAKGSPVYLYDRIVTTAKSFVVINFTDQGKLTLRPDSVFAINDYSDLPGQEKESFSLIKGGLRAVTGAIGKNNPDKVVYSTRGNTIGIRGTEFVVRLCEECAFDNTAESVRSAQQPQRNDINDELTLVQKDGQRREVSREQLRDLLQGIYVSVIEGVIRLSNDDWYIDIGAGDACFDQLVDEASGEDEESEVNCFLRGERLEDTDPYLGGDEEGLMYWNQLGDEDGFVEGNTICEIL